MNQTYLTSTIPLDLQP